MKGTEGSAKNFDRGRVTGTETRVSKERARERRRRLREGEREEEKESDARGRGVPVCISPRKTAPCCTLPPTSSLT
eukprot:787932-Rhodomonas_salina.1